MKPLRTIRAAVLMAALVLTAPAMAFGQVAVRIKKDEDLTYRLPWRNLQKGRIAVDSIRPNCQPSPADAPGPAGPGSSLNIVPKMLGGQPSPNCMFRDLVRIDFVSSFGAEARCTGVMISEGLVLTAAHCACGSLSTYELRKHGEYVLAPDGADSTPIYYLSKPPSLFDGYVCDVAPEFQAGRDLAILAIESEEEKEERADGFFGTRSRDRRYAGLNVATAGEIFADGAETTTLVGAGYGEIDDGGFPDRPHFAAIPIASLFCSQGRFAGSLCEAHREFVLANSLVRRSGRLSDSCGGDSGAPIMYVPPDVPANPDKPHANVSQGIMLVGITSRGLRGVSHQTVSRCGGGGIYTAVGHPDVVAWLRSFKIDIFSLLPSK
jgi:hypothetical protein